MTERTRRRWLLALAALLSVAAVYLGSTGRTYAEGWPGVVTIEDDDGGSVDDHVKFYKRLLVSGFPVRVDGMCVSACTFVLMLPPEQWCMTERSSFGFHQVTIGSTSQPMMTEAIIRRYYPKGVQEWIAAWVKKNGPMKVSPIVFMSAAEAYATGAINKCADGPVVNETVERQDESGIDGSAGILDQMIRRGGFGTVDETKGE